LKEEDKAVNRVA